MSLHVTYDILRREVGRFLGYDRDPDNWEDNETLDCEDILKSGLRSFYWPVVGEQRYAWTFLRKSGTITTVSGTMGYLLATDFEGATSGITYAVGAARRRIARASEEDLLSWMGKAESSGAPLYFAIRAVQPVEGSQMRYEALLGPIPDAVYSLTYRYSISPPELSALNQYHLGGAAHSECVLEACLAAAEKTLRPENGPGIHEAKFQQLLQASMKLDAEMQ